MKESGNYTQKRGRSVRASMRNYCVIELNRLFFKFIYSLRTVCKLRVPGTLQLYASATMACTYFLILTNGAFYDVDTIEVLNSTSLKKNDGK